MRPKLIRPSMATVTIIVKPTKVWLIRQLIGRVLFKIATKFIGCRDIILVFDKTNIIYRKAGESK